MEYTTFGSTGMEVSKICLGCMSFSEDGEGWRIDRDQSREIVERAIDLGVTFFDTANTYQNGESETVLGDALSEYDPDQFVVATKGRWGSGQDHGNATGLSRKALDEQLRNSLDRLGLDTIDLYQIHRWDDSTPVDVTLRTLDDAVSRGDVRYIGASSMWAHQFIETHRVSERLGFEPFRTMQPFYNLVYRERERELLPYCEKENVGVMPWSPLEHGYLTRPDEEWTSTDRGAGLQDNPHPIREGNNPEINRRVEELAEEKGVTMAQVALAWLFQNDWVDAPILGVTSVEHLEQAVAALDIDLSEDDVAYLEEPYTPVRVSGWDGARERMGYEQE
ncbi:aldo/keto reductase [Halosimplex pelagicum]|uniref:Aldo/keto reductase n=1 Tax=Halosimplex pelagicum TaxID=869886 RepID=A0A7D5P6F8_9EURY|nr:aldo/keto reductase [Halosimplex pelagicum]QLH82017.1 aldo/keto reductase [Halosimplex pelagicum]